MDELSTYVLYDIPDDSLRSKIADTCKDYGLERIQFSAFYGSLNRNKREELFLRLNDVLRDRPGKTLIQPVCEKDVRCGLSIENEEQNSRSTDDDAESQRSQAV